jgi:hypothetical protein
MLPTDDTYVPGYLIAKTAEVVGAVRAAAFLVRPGPDGVSSLELYKALPDSASGSVSARQLADGLRRFVVPSLAVEQDQVIEVPELSGPLQKTFVLIIKARDPSAALRGVTAMVVECGSRAEAERRLASLHKIMS